MYNFTGRPSTATTGASTSSSSTLPRPGNGFGTSNTSQVFVFGSGAQNPPTIPPVNNPPANPPSIFQFGTNQVAPSAQPTNSFGSNPTGTTFPFTQVSSQVPFATPSTTTNIFGVNNTTTTPANVFGTTTSAPVNTSGGLHQQTFPAAPASSTNLFRTGNNIFGQPTSNVTSPFDPPKSTASGLSGIQSNPFNIGPSATQPSSNTMTNSNTSTLFRFGSQPVIGTNLFPQPTTTVPFNNTAQTTMINPTFPASTSAPTTTPAFPGFLPTASTASASNIFPVPTTSTAYVFPTGNAFPTPATVPATAQFPPASSATSLLNPTGPSGTIATSIYNPLAPTGSPITGTLPVGTSSSSTVLPQEPKREQNAEQTMSITQQHFLIASLLDPYANRGKKEFTNIDQIAAPAVLAAVSTVSPTTSTVTITTSTPIPVTLPLQSNLRTASPSRSVVDVNFKLRPVSSSPTLHDQIKPANQQFKVPTAPVKSTLAGSFTDEEELVLLGRTKLSKLRLSNDTIRSSSPPANPLHSLYPVRRLADLESLTNIPSRSSSPTTTITVNHERTSRPSSDSREVSPNQRLPPSVSSKQPFSPIVQRKSSEHDSRKYRLPILTRDNYYMKPTSSELKNLFNDNGQCILKEFTVGHAKYGSVTFYGQIDVAGLNLDEIIEINRHEMIVYPDDDHKPAVGEELNRSARITLLDVYPVDRTTRTEITDIERIKAMNYSDYLREMTKKFDGEFVKYDPTDGSWTFMVKHFTRYGLDENQTDSVLQS